MGSRAFGSVFGAVLVCEAFSRVRVVRLGAVVVMVVWWCGGVCPRCRGPGVRLGAVVVVCGGVSSVLGFRGFGSVQWWW